MVWLNGQLEPLIANAESYMGIRSGQDRPQDDGLHAMMYLWPDDGAGLNALEDEPINMGRQIERHWPHQVDVLAAVIAKHIVENRPVIEALIKTLGPLQLGPKREAPERSRFGQQNGGRRGNGRVGLRNVDSHAVP
ncbi:hypothetical protein N8D56_02370 [Devosia sp. A8/3-2]|nr:hypothetical protein N8D56_02370 [Devosia sp. A8/3-2]